MTLSPMLVFRSTEKPGRPRDGWAESAWVTTANGLDVQLCGHAMRWQDRAAHVEVTTPTGRTKSNEEEGSAWTALRRLYFGLLLGARLRQS